MTLAQTDWIDAKAKNEVVGIMAFDLSAVFDTLEYFSNGRGWQYIWILIGYQLDTYSIFGVK